MPKLPRIGGRECVAALQKLGFVVVRQRGSHIVMRARDPKAASCPIIAKFAWEHSPVFYAKLGLIRKNF